MNRSDDISKLAMALSKFQGSMPIIEKTKTAKIKNKEGKNIYEYLYADLADINRAVQIPLSSNELSICQIFVIRDQVHYLQTYLLHSSGQWMMAELRIAEHEKIQMLGGEITYLRRYSFGAILGLVTDEDDDGKKANEDKRHIDKSTGEIKPPAAKIESKPATNGNCITEKQVKFLYAQTKDHPEYRENLKKEYPKFEEIPQKNMNGIMAHFEQYKADKSREAANDFKQDEIQF